MMEGHDSLVVIIGCIFMNYTKIFSTVNRYTPKEDKISPMMTSSNGNIFHVTGPLCGEFTGHRWIPHTKASDAEFDVFYDMRLNKWLSKQAWGWWFETPSRSLWRHCNALDWVNIVAAAGTTRQKSASADIALTQLCVAIPVSASNGAVTKILASGGAAFIESCAAIGWNACDSVRSL